jgi:hypothetical protein
MKQYKNMAFALWSFVSYGIQDVYLDDLKEESDKPTHAAGNRTGNKKRIKRIKHSKPTRTTENKIRTIPNENQRVQYYELNDDERQYMLRKLHLNELKNLIFQSKLKAETRPILKLENNTECCVSYRIIENDELYIKCPQCKNNLSYEVGFMWINEKHSCPMCRFYIKNIDEISWNNKN